MKRERFSEYEKYIDPVSRAAEIKQPIFIIHGERDRIVHPDEAKLMLDALKTHNLQVQTRFFPQSSHTYWPFADRVVELNEIASFLDRYVGPSP